MDFLNPKWKKSHHRRLFIGYLLMAVAIAMGTLILLFNANGFDIDRKTGGVIQNGTVFVESRPSGSTVYLNGTAQRNKTGTKLALPGGQQYTISLENEGYREWTRTFSLNGGQIERLVYPLLIPKTLKTAELQLYATSPAMTTQSPGRRWLLVQQPGQTMAFDKYDLNNPGNSPPTINIPGSLVAEPNKAATITAVEWSSNERHVLIDRFYDDKHEYILLDTDTPSNSVNIGQTLGVEPRNVTLRDKRSDQVYILESSGSLRSGDLKNLTLSAPLINNVITYDSHGQNAIAYITKTGAPEGKVNVRLRDDEQATYLLKTISESPEYLVEADAFESTPYFIVGSSAEDAVFVYRDPLPTLKGQNNKALMVTAVLRLNDPTFLSFSINKGFIAAQTGNNVAVYDIENDRQFRISLPHQLDASDELVWIDGYRLSFNEKGTSYIVDFDGSNRQPLVPAGGELIFSPDYEKVFSIAPSTVKGRFAFTSTDLTLR